MALSLNIPSSGTLRISQILPTIKCSRCGEETDINFADQHVCKPASITPATTPPAKASEQRPISRSTDRASTVSSISVPSVSSYSTGSRSSTSTKRAPSVRSTRTIQQSPPTDPPVRPQHQSTASYTSYRSRGSADDSTPRGSPPPRSSPSPVPTLRSDSQAASPVSDSGSSLVLRSVPSPTPRSGPSPSPTARSGPSPAPFSSSSPPAASGTIPSRTTPSPVSSIPVSRTPAPESPTSPTSLPFTAPLAIRKSSRSAASPLPAQPPPPTHAPPPPDTKSGGEAGMAGVGRRGFAAAAQAAFFVTGPHKFGVPSSGPTSVYGYPGSIRAEPGQLVGSPTSPVDGRYLHIRTDMSNGTPPLSHSPVSASPMSRPHSPTDNRRSPGAEIARPNSRSPSPVDVIDGSGPRSAAKGKGAVGGLASLVNKIRQNSGGSSPLPSAVAAGKQPMRTVSPEPITTEAVLDRGRSRAASNARSRQGSSGADSETELAYGSWRSPSPPPVDRRKASLDVVDEIEEEEKSGEENTIEFPRRGSNDSDRAPKRSGSQSSGYSSSSSGSQSGGTRRIKQSAGAQTLSALREEDEDDDACSAYTTPSSAEVDGAFMVAPVSTVIEEPKINANTLSALGSDLNRLGVDMDRLGLPTRSKTSASASSSSSSATRRRRVRTCAKCEKRIEDGRWIKVDDGNGGNAVLCESDWKMLYLPKCRQCGLSIETQAIYASDGQLKGKYHKECFNCYTCHQPFPDRSFYIYQERPYCKYHYHEANNSLCASPSCREPIEGPCAVSHTGARYHREHFGCEYEDMDGRCNAQLSEYWEIKGERMCERHVRNAEENRGAQDGGSIIKATKRRTVFMNLGAGNEVGLC